MALRHKSATDGSIQNSSDVGVRSRVPHATSSSLDKAESGQEAPANSPSWRSPKRRVANPYDFSENITLRSIHRRLYLRCRRLSVESAARWLGGAFLLMFSGLAIFFHWKLDDSTVQPSAGAGRSISSNGIPQPRVTRDFGVTMGDIQLPSRLLFKSIPDETSIIRMPIPFGDTSFLEEPDFGGLEFDFFEEENAKRQIFHFFDLDRTEFRRPSARNDDDMEGYYLFDDDGLRGLPTNYNRDNIHDPAKRCRRVAEHRLNLQNCNNVHELGWLESSVKYLNAGYWRQVFALNQQYAGNDNNYIAIKDLSYEHKVAYDNFEYIRMDATVAERLSSNPRTFDIYGFCGLSILSEFFSHGDVEEVVQPGNMKRTSGEMQGDAPLVLRNKLTATQKVVLALEMAEGLAFLHGYPTALIIHDDVQLSQFLFNNDKSMLKLNDFNRAEFPLFDEKNNEYCRYKNGRGHGNWRSPEEYKDRPLTEKIDVWSMGNNMYGILSGLDPDTKNHSKKLKDHLVRGETAYIDPRYKERSPEESSLVELIEKCFIYKPGERISMFELVVMLRQVVEESFLRHSKPGGPQLTRANVMRQIQTKL